MDARFALRIAHYVGLLTATGALCTSPAHAALEASQTHVVGGLDAADCAWPGVMFAKVISPKDSSELMCTATLVHPRLVLYAAHCGTLDHLRIGNGIIDFERKIEGPEIEKNEIHPESSTTLRVEYDWAFAVLKEPITDVPIVPIAFGCEVDEIVKQGQAVHLVGFSPNKTDSEPNPPAESGNYPLRWANSTVSRLDGRTLTTGGNGVHACTGDSGGPLMAKLSDGSWRTIGITSTKRGECRSRDAVNRYSRIGPEAVKWIETQSGIDITPCYDQSGNPTPSPECDTFMAYADNPSAPEGTWDNMCSEAPTKSVREYCDVPESGEDSSTDTSSNDEPETSAGESSGAPSDDSPEEPPPSTGDESDTQDQPSPPDSPKDDSKNSSESSGSSESPEDPTPSPSEESSSPQGDDSGAPPPSGACSLAGGTAAMGWLWAALGWLAWRRRRAS